MLTWKLSHEAEQDAIELRDKIRSSFLQGRVSTVVTLIEKLADRGEPAGIPVVASGLFSKVNAIHEAASAAVGRLLLIVPSVELIQFSEMLGGYGRGFISTKWMNLKHTFVQAFLAKTKDVSAGNLLSFHRNGFVRQVAVQFLADTTSGEELRFLLIRQNDWVDSISNDAQASIHARLTPDYVNHFVRETELLFRTSHFKRRDLNEMVERYIDLLAVQSHEGVLQIAMQSRDKRAIRWLVDQLLNRDGKHHSTVVRFGLRLADPVVRVKCLNRASEFLPRQDCDLIAERFRFAPVAVVREAAYRLSAQLSESPEKVWRKAMLDNNRALRETAIYFLRKSGCEVAALYRKVLAESENSLPALSGLVGCGDETDLEVFFQYLDSPLASRRAEAIRGIGKFGCQSDVLELQKMLFDQSARVVRVAYHYLKPVAKMIDSDWLFNQLESCQTIVGYHSALQLLVKKGRWQSLSYLIRAAVSADDILSTQSKAMIHLLFSLNRVFTQPSADQRKQIQAAIDDRQLADDEDFLLALKSYLSSFEFEFASG